MLMKSITATLFITAFCALSANANEEYRAHNGHANACRCVVNSRETAQCCNQARGVIDPITGRCDFYDESNKNSFTGCCASVCENKEIVDNNQNNNHDENHHGGYQDIDSYHEKFEHEFEHEHDHNDWK